MDTPELPRGALLALTAAVDLAMLAAAIGGGWWLGLPWWTGLGVHLHGLIVGTVAGLALLGGIWAFVHGEGPVLAGLREAFRRDLREVFGVLAPLRASDLVAVSLGAGLVEEALFRGLIEAAGDAWLGAGPALAAIAFGLAHPLSRTYLAYTAVLGLVLSAVVVLGQGLFAAMVAHAVYDAAALLAGRRSPIIAEPPAEPDAQG